MREMGRTDRHEREGRADRHERGATWTGTRGGGRLGQIIRLHCQQCGFERELYVGGGLADSEWETIQNALPEKERHVLDAAVQAGASQIQVTRRLCVCGRCGAVYALPVVSCMLKGEQGVLYGVCPQCGAAGDPDWEEEGAIPCPVCRSGLTKQQAGHWD